MFLRVRSLKRVLPFSPRCGHFEGNRWFCSIGENDERAAKKRYMMAVAYKGTEYKGVQLFVVLTVFALCFNFIWCRHPSVVTIQGEIHNAIRKLDWITEIHHENPAQVSWDQCSRTDKGNIYLTYLVAND